jgi:macrolide transport system ATP-binding/permease protein
MGVMLTAVGVLVAAALVAGIIPARRAASINPVQALRVD